MPIIYNIYGITEVSVWASIFQVIPSSPDFPTIHGFDTENLILLGEPLSDTFFEVRDCTTGSIIHAGCGELFIGTLILFPYTCFMLLEKSAIKNTIILF